MPREARLPPKHRTSLAPLARKPHIEHTPGKREIGFCPSSEKKARQRTELNYSSLPLPRPPSDARRVLSVLAPLSARAGASCGACAGGGACASCATWRACRP